ncbi:MAG: class I SAM-dependent methyltransferase [Bacteroidota bacterium]
MTNNKEWFADWFNSPYYHILYKDRDYTEAEMFLNNVIAFFNMPQNAHVIDLACGKGRHSVFLNKAGFNVLGVDLSANSIAFAKQFENETLHFAEADLRCLNRNNEFDYAFNLFTSFAYFKSDTENHEVLHQFNACLKPNGFLLLDFFNAEKIKLRRNCVDTKEIEGITFHTSKEIADNKIYKTIKFEAEGEKHSYQEEVQLLLLADFEKLFEDTNFKIIKVFGNYSLENFDATESDRLIFIAQKK